MQDVNAVSVKVPPIWRKNIEVWFVQIEAMFLLANITIETTKFNHVLCALEADVADAISDLLTKPLSATPYQDLKKRIIREFQESDSKKVNRLLNDLTLGDKKPSAFLREMRALAGNQVQDEFLKTLFLQRMPENVSFVLAAAGSMTLDVLADMADRIHDTTHTHVNSVRDPVHDKIKALEEKHAQEIKRLENVIAEMSVRGRSSERRTSSKHRRYSRSKTPKKHQICWYHRRFKEKSTRCTTPCAYNSQAEN